jgi:hypothetical protein
MKFLEVIMCTVGDFQGPISTADEFGALPRCLDFDRAPRCLVIVAFRVQKIIVVPNICSYILPKAELDVRPLNQAGLGGSLQHANRRSGEDALIPGIHVLDSAGHEV